MNIFKSKPKRSIGKSQGNFNKCIIDIGCSYNAPRGKLIKKLLKLPCIYIDPDLSALAMLKVEAEDLLLNVAIGEKNRLSKLFCYQEGTHSLLQTNLNDINKYIDGYTGKSALIKDWTPKEEIYVPTLTIDSIVDDIGIESIEALKIDAQGYDYQILLGANASLKKVKYIELEVQLTEFEVYKNQSKEEDIKAYMSSNNFELISRELQTFNQEANLFYVNKSLDLVEKNFYRQLLQI
jgi:FkbM family methyltransferase